MSVQSKWIKFKGGIDHFISGIDGLGVSGFSLNIVWGALITFGVGVSTILVQDACTDDFSENFDKVQRFDNGVILKFPEDCDLYSPYMISNKSGGGLELSRVTLGHSSAYALSRAPQQDLAADIDTCLVDLSQSVAKADFDFADDFWVATNITYSDVGLIYERNSQASHLRKDIIDWDEKLLSLEDVVEERADFDDDRENVALFTDEFNKVVHLWATYLAQQNDVDPYFDDGSIKDANQYQKYETYDLTGNHWWSLWGGSATILLMFSGVSSSSYRPAAYHKRQKARDEQLAALTQPEEQSGPA